MVNSKEKGARAEAQAVQLLKEYTGLDWHRTPFSGALDAGHKLKGDVYVPGEKNIFSVEVKHYADDAISSSLLTAKSCTLFRWWEQAEEQAHEVSLRPLLLFKHDRSKWFVCSTTRPKHTNFLLILTDDQCLYISIAEEWLQKEHIDFIC